MYMLHHNLTTEAELLHSQAYASNSYHKEIINHGSEDALLPTILSTFIQQLLVQGFEHKLIDMLYQETLEGKLVGSKITNCDCVRLAERLNNLRIKRVDSSQVKGKIARLKKIQRQFTNLMGQTGMVWNPITKTVIGSDEHWENAIQVRSEWKKFKNSGCGNYDVLCTIFG
ncbi:uncharacterized protein LOC122305682 [Carya illinoinensis]|uniref:uncharacterized protein LOC122305682 n=1 Tax=Carya illinoinensis TaxID=32201 RepID=UPI001C724198|nr:uncharacterized protein LOC122305682 [Carya illinoinensis]